MNTIKKQTLIIAMGTMILGVLGGYLIFGNSDSVESELHIHDTTGSEEIWTCSMHPQIRQNEPGNCPICGMELIPLGNAQNESLDPNSISMSPTAMQLANVQTIIIGKTGADKTLKLSGKIQTDERLLFTQATHLPGRIEQLMVNFTGEYITKGQTIALIYSPELSVAQEELLQVASLKDSQPNLYQASIKKLKNWKISDDQIDNILSNGKPIQQFPIKANVSGFVTKKLANLGDHLMNGQAIYEVSDLSRIWVLFDVYESELAWVKKGDQIEYTISSIPGEIFHGKISYLDPVIDPVTRVSKARIEVANPQLRLKPEMFVSGTLKTSLTTSTDAFSIPKSAVMWTGKRSIVYVKSGDERNIRFSLREVTLGPATEDNYLVEHGLEEGEEIVVNGTFSIDAAAQLSGKYSMMNQPQSKTLKVPMEFRKQITTLADSYFSVKNALVNDNIEASKTALSSVNASLEKINMALLDNLAHEHWMEIKNGITGAVTKMNNSKEISEIRKNFSTLSENILEMTETFGLEKEVVYKDYCPMAFGDQGAYWLSEIKDITNPYFGTSMLTCGEVKQTYLKDQPVMASDLNLTKPASIHNH